MADDPTDQAPADAPAIDPKERLALLEAENARLRAQLAAYEPPPKPIQEYPKWATKRTADSVERVLVQDEAAFHALGEGWE